LPKLSDVKAGRVVIVSLGTGPNRLLILLLVGDCVFILLHVFWLMDWMSNPLLSIERDRGYAEGFQYLKECSIALLLLVLATRRRQAVYLAWSVLFAYFLIDDSFKIHEQYGRMLAHYLEWQPMFRLRTEDIGELAVSVIVGILVFTSIAVSYSFGGPAARKASRHLCVLVAILVFFGVVVDMLHIALSLGKDAIGLIEDGGEMLTMSVIAWYVVKLVSSPQGPARAHRQV